MATQAMRTGGASWSQRKSTQTLIRQGVIQLVLAILGISFVVPFVWMVSTSLKPDSQIFLFPPKWIPDPVLFTNYPKSMAFVPLFPIYIRNTLFIAVMSVIGVLFSCPLAAYSLARIPWRGREPLFIITIATMMLPGQVTLIPLFVVFKNLGMVGTFFPLILPSYFGSAFFIFLLRQFFMTIPKELSEAARIDGANEFTIYTRLMLPLIRPALATIALFEFTRQWKDFLGPLIYLSKAELYTVSVGLQQYKYEYDTQWAFLMAASVIVTFPIIILFFFTQRTFIQGITLTGIKG
jgi:multiple sugar transport system permease protein